MFAEEDLAPRRTASRLLRDVRSIRPQVPPLPRPEDASAPEFSVTASSAELPVSYLPLQASASTDAAAAAVEAELSLEASGAVETGDGGEVGADDAVAATPALRSAALQRLAQLFGGGTAVTQSSPSYGDGEAPTPPLSPVQRYIEHRWAFCCATQQ